MTVFGIIPSPSKSRFQKKRYYSVERLLQGWHMKILGIDNPAKAEMTMGETLEHINSIYYNVVVKVPAEVKRRMDEAIYQAYLKPLDELPNDYEIFGENQ